MYREGRRGSSYRSYRFSATINRCLFKNCSSERGGAISISSDGKRGKVWKLKGSKGLKALKALKEKGSRGKGVKGKGSKAKGVKARCASKKNILFLSVLFSKIAQIVNSFCFQN